MINTTNKTDVLNLLWLKTACSTDPNRYILQYIYADENCLIATDGRRLHKLNKEGMSIEIPDGLYKMTAVGKSQVLLEDCSDQGNFPNWKQVIPKSYSQEKELTVEYEGVACICALTGLCIKVSFLIDACGFGTVHGKKSGAFAGKIKLQEKADLH